MAKIQYSPQAVEDLQQIQSYITSELCNAKAANSTIAKILRQVNTLQQFPMAGPALSSIVNFETDYRFLVCGSYTAFYRVEDQYVKIVRVLYARRDFMRILFGTEQQISEQ